MSGSMRLIWGLGTWREGILLVVKIARLPLEKATAGKCCQSWHFTQMAPPVLKFKRNSQESCRAGLIPRVVFSFGDVTVRNFWTA